MPIYYLATRPETVFSVVTVGRLPEALPTWVETRELELYPQAENSAKSSTTKYHQTFILEVHLPEPEVESNYLVTKKISSSQHEIALCTCEQIKPEWIKNILVFSATGNKLVSRLFNAKPPVPIQIKPKIFPDNVKIEKKTFNPPLNNNITIKNNSNNNWIYVKKGDLLGSKMQTIINTVNCVGVMGKGIAFTCKQRYPQMFKEYQQRCSNKQLQIGAPYLYKQNDNRWIINFPTKEHWKNDSKIEYVEKGLKYLADHIKEWKVTSIAIPPLGCGNGKLNWKEVEPLIEKYLKPIGIPTEIYVPTENTNIKSHSKKSKVKNEKTAKKNTSHFFKRKIEENNQGKTLDDKVVKNIHEINMFKKKKIDVPETKSTEKKSDVALNY